MHRETSQRENGSDLVRAGAGARRYELRRTWVERLPAIVIIGGFIVAALLSDSSGWELLVLLMLGFAVLSEWVVWPRANYIIIHPRHVDTSQLGWGSKMRKRRRHRIRYEDVISVSCDERTGKLNIAFKPSGGLGRRFGIQTWWVNAVLQRPPECAELRDAIELGRARANTGEIANLA
jgi:hypothetical protein